MSGRRRGHLAWFVIDAVAAMDLMAFYVSYRVDGWGRAAHDPAMMVAQALIALRELAGDRVRVTCSPPSRTSYGPAAPVADRAVQRSAAERLVERHGRGHRPAPVDEISCNV